MKKKQLLSWLPVLLCMAVIYCFSAQTGAESGEISKGVLTVLDPLVKPLYQALPPADRQSFLDGFHLLIRKSAHFCIYGALGFFALRAFGNYSLKPKTRALFALLLSFLYACSDEWHQGTVAGRGPSFGDVLLDTAGACTAVGLCLLIRFWQNKQKNKTQSP